MKLNIFRIPPDQLDSLSEKLIEKGLVSKHELDQDGWKGNFFFSETPTPSKIPWVNTFAKYIGSKEYFNRSYFATILLAKDDSCYAITFGKAHFFVRPYCDYDFGIELAKRIADENDVTQTSARRYQGKQKKDIRSFVGQSRLNVPPGNSLDYLQGKVIPEKVDQFGQNGKFGTSALLAPDIASDKIGSLLSKIDAELAEDPRFKLPRTIVLSDDDEVARYDKKLVDELVSPVGVSEIAVDTFDLFGVDFVFSSSGSFTLKCGNHKALDVDRLTMKEVKEYIVAKKIPRDKILSLKITHHREEDLSFTQTIKEALDFICDEDRVVLRGGKWLKFNDDYLDALDVAIRRIEVEETEADLIETSLTEGEFNQRLSAYGYDVADKDFEIFKTSARTAVEAWDLQKGQSVYAVKFGTPQKLNYVVDQASNVLELIHNHANLSELPQFRRYCLWMGYRAKKLPESLAESGSIILKQKVESWARQCEEVGFIPMLKLSRKLHQEHDVSSVSTGKDVGSE